MCATESEPIVAVSFAKLKGWLVSGAAEMATLTEHNKHS